MSGSPVTLPAPKFPSGRRLALVVAATNYTDPALRGLRAPATDAADLARVLADPEIGGFDVTSVLDPTVHDLRVAILDFLMACGPEDLVVLYLSCHGLQDLRRRLYFAATNTSKSRLGATGLESTWVYTQLEECRAHSQILILDCCFSGAFARGAKGDDGDQALQDQLVSSGRGLAVLTASNAREYSFEGGLDGPLAPGTPAPGSVFTTALLAGLRNGAADSNGDGLITVEEAYDYASREVRAKGFAQTPQRSLSGGEGRIILARNPAGRPVIPTRLPESLRTALDSPHPYVRLGAVNELGGWLTSGDPSRERTARSELQDVADNDNHLVAGAASAMLGPNTTPPAAAATTTMPGAALAAAAATTAPAPEPSASTTFAEPCLVYRGHKEGRIFRKGVLSVAFSPNGALLASSGADRTVRLWNQATGRRYRTLTGHTGCVGSVAFSPDGRLLASGSDDRTVRLYPAAGEHRTLTGHIGSVTSVAFSPDGALLASGSDDRTVRLWNLTTGKHQRTLTGHIGSVTSVAFSPNGALLASGSDDATVRLWKLTTGEHHRTLTGHTSSVTSVAFSPDGALLASGSFDETLCLWNPTTGGHHCTLTGHTDSVTSVVFASDGVLLATASDDKTIVLWGYLTD